MLEFRNVENYKVEA